MATITITISDANLPRVVSALCQLGGYAELPDPKPNQSVFARATLIQELKRIVLNTERSNAASAAVTSITEISDIT